MVTSHETNRNSICKLVQLRKVIQITNQKDTCRMIIQVLSKRFP
uniref:Uncharacterized protein n=1 Tax=Arundo donax TaxID=35708 RepID=A0A0A9G0D1_ARUDO